LHKFWALKHQTFGFKTRDIIQSVNLNTPFDLDLILKFDTKELAEERKANDGIMAYGYEVTCIFIEVRQEINEPVLTEESNDHKELWGKTEGCTGNVVSAGPGGGAKCTECAGWFCY
jgi:hypothetical protein